MRKALKYKNLKLRKSLKNQKFFNFFDKSLMNQATKPFARNRWKLLKILSKQETPRNICIITNKTRDVKRLVKLSGSTFKHYAIHQEISGFKKSSW